MIDVSRDDAVWLITLNRPDKANSLTKAMLQELVQISREAQEARAVILTGAGSVFSAGADLGEARTGLATSSLWEELSGAIAALPGMTVAALNGTLAGGAFGMALACDIRIAAPEAKFFYPVMKLGFLPQPSDPGRLSALIGAARAKLILMGAQKITADDALSFGLIDRIVPSDDVISEARTLVEYAVAAPQDVAHQIKQMCL
ncbi:MAG: enoyl-CoA hydratase/isomerase family protein [Pseudomonadota bacterium]